MDGWYDERLKAILEELRAMRIDLNYLAELKRKHRHVWIRDYEGVPVCKSCGEENWG